jgi:hypothetical protein
MAGAIMRGEPPAEAWNLALADERKTLVEFLRINSYEGRAEAAGTLGNLAHGNDTDKAAFVAVVQEERDDGCHVVWI